MIDGFPRCQGCRYWLPIGRLFTAQDGYCWHNHAQTAPSDACNFREYRDDTRTLLLNEAMIARGE